MNIKLERHTSLASLLSAALSAAEEGPVFYLAGGTDLMVQKDMLPAGTWLDISDIPDLHGIRQQKDCIIIGSGVSHHEIMRSPLLKKHAPALVQASSNVGGPQVRSRGTIGGNLGNASPAADTVPALYSLRAVLNLISSEGERSVPVDEFALRPRRTVLKPGEIIHSVSIPIREGIQGFWHSIVQRNSLAISKINIGFSYVLKAENSQAFDYVGVAFGSVGPTVLRAKKTEAFLLAEPLTPQRLEEACLVAQSEVTPIADIRSTAEYRKAMARVLMHEALEPLFK